MNKDYSKNINSKCNVYIKWKKQGLDWIAFLLKILQISGKNIDICKNFYLTHTTNYNFSCNKMLKINFVATTFIGTSASVVLITQCCVAKSNCMISCTTIKLLHRILKDPDFNRDFLNQLNCQKGWLNFLSILFISKLFSNIARLGLV